MERAVVAGRGRAGDEGVTTEVAPRLQDAVVEAARRVGDTGADDCLAGWVRTPWTRAEGTPTGGLDRVTSEFEGQDDRITECLRGLGQ